MGNKNKLKLTKVLEVGNQLDLDNGEVSSGWTGSADVTSIEASTTHVTGANSISFDKSLVTETTGTISKTIGGANGKNGSMFAIQRLKLNLNLGSIADIASVSLTLGTDASNNNVYTTADSALSTGWNELNYNCDDPTTINGDGINWFNIKYVAVTVTLDATSDTLADILVDTIYLYKSNSGGAPTADVNIALVNGSTPNLAKETGGGIASLDTKQGTTGEAAAVAGTRAAQLRYIGDAIEATRSLLQYPDTPINLNKAVTTAGTAEQITATAKKGYLIIKALAANTNNIYLGDSGVDSTNGLVLDAGESVTIASDNLGEWYIDSDTNGEGVSVAGAYIN